MRIYKNKGVKTIYIEVVDRRQQVFRKVLRFATGFRDEKLARDIGNHVEQLIDYAAYSDRPNFEAIQWLTTYAPKSLQDKLVELGLLPEKETVKPLIDYLPEFEQTIKLIARKDKTGKQAAITISRVKRIIEECSFAYWQDVIGEKIDIFIYNLRAEGLSKQSAKFYIQAFRRFALWMVGKGYGKQYWSMQEEKGRKQGIRSISVPRSIERAFELDEYSKLLSTVRDGFDSYGLTGYQRYLLYQLAVETGLRREELRSLTPVSFNFKERTVFVKGDDTKNSDDAEQDISPEMAQLAKDYIKDKMPTVQLFPIHDKSAKMIQADCKAAGITVKNIKGKIKFHTLRHTCGSFLIAQGANLKIVQEVMRHKSIDITISRYGHLLKDQKKSAVAGLGKLSVTKEAEDKKLGA